MKKYFKVSLKQSSYKTIFKCQTKVFLGYLANKIQWGTIHWWVYKIFCNNNRNHIKSNYKNKKNCKKKKNMIIGKSSFSPKKAKRKTQKIFKKKKLNSLSHNRLLKNSAKWKRGINWGRVNKMIRLKEMYSIGIYWALI